MSDIVKGDKSGVPTLQAAGRRLRQRIQGIYDLQDKAYARAEAETRARLRAAVDEFAPEPTISTGPTMDVSEQSTSETVPQPETTATI